MFASLALNYMVESVRTYVSNTHAHVRMSVRSRLDGNLAF